MERQIFNIYYSLNQFIWLISEKLKFFNYFDAEIFPAVFLKITLNSKLSVHLQRAYYFLCMPIKLLRNACKQILEIIFPQVNICFKLVAT